jgi:glycerophosphoryl diester phosphodiesterase
MMVLINFLWLMPLGQGLFCALRWGHLNYPALMLDFLTRKTWLLIIAGAALSGSADDWLFNAA